MSAQHSAAAPLVSVVMPAYKARYLAQALASVKAQTHRPLELVVCDDSRTSQIEAMVQAFGAEVDFNVLYQRNETRLWETRSTARGIGFASGVYIKFLHDDDVLHPECIASLVNAMESSPDIALAAARRRTIDPEGAPRPFELQTCYPFNGDVCVEGASLTSFLADYTLNFIGEPSAVLCRRQDLLPFGDGLSVLDGVRVTWVADLSLYVKLLRGGNLAMLARPLVDFRVSPEQYSQLGRDKPGIGDQGHADFRRGVKALGWYQGDGDARSVGVSPLGAATGFLQVDLAHAIGQAYAQARTQQALRDWQAQRVTLPTQRPLLDARLGALGGAPRLAILVRAAHADADAVSATLGSIPTDLPAGATPLLVLLGQAAQYVPGVYRQEPDELPETLVRLIASLEADWLMLVDAGTCFHAGGLQRLLLELAQHPQASAVYADEWERDTAGALAPVLRPDDHLELLLGNPAVMSRHWVFNRRELCASGGFDTEHVDAMELDLILRLPLDAMGSRAVHLPEPLVTAAAAQMDATRLRAIQHAIVQHLSRRGYPNAQVRAMPGGLFRIDYRHATWPPVSIVVIARDALALLQRCVLSLLEKTSYPAYELLLVDNASDGREVSQWMQQVAELAPGRIRIFALGQRASAADAANLAASQAEGEFVVFLDATSAIVQPTWLDELVNHGQRPEVGIVGAKTVSADGLVTHAGLVPGLQPHHGHVFATEPLANAGYMGRLQTAQRYSAVSGRCMLVRRSVLAELGGFDAAAFPDRNMDVDLCLRAATLGYWTVWTPHALLLQPAEVVAETAAGDDALLARWLHALAHDKAYSPSLSLDQPGGFKLGESSFSWQPLSWKPLPRLLAHPADLEGSGQYRVVQPLEALRLAAQVEGTYYGQLLTPVDMERISPDVVILQRRIGDQALAQIERMRRFSGAFRIYELDDYLPNLPFKSVHRQHMPDDIKRSLRRAAALVDRMVVSTPALANALEKLHADIHVVENRLDPRTWQGVRPARRLPPGKPRVGWAGGASHAGDLEMIADVVESLATEVDWIFMGMCPDRLRPYVAEIHPGVPFDRYPQALAALQLDLAVAPLEDNLFNRCKSNLRLLEYGACGYPVVASDLLPYQNSLPVTRVKNRYRDWVSAIRMHVSDRFGCVAAGDALGQAVQRDWMLAGQNLDAWRHAWLPG